MNDNKKVVNLAGREVGEDRPTFIICEAGVTNFGDMKLAKRQADVAFRAEVDVIKYQASVVSDLVSKKVSQRLAKDLGFDWYKRVAYKYFPLEKLKGLFDYCQKLGISVFATAHDDKSLNFLDKELNVPFFKIGSGEAHNFEFLKNVGSRKKPVIISFGAQSEKEIIRAINTLKEAGAKDIIALECSTSYPTPAHLVDLARMRRLKKLLDVPVGLSDHSVGWHIPLAAVAQGACMIEKHLTFNKTDFRSLDNPGALLPNEFAKMVSEIREVERAMRDLPEEDRLQALQKGRDWAGQCLIAKQDIPAATVLAKEMIVFKRPGKGGLPPQDIEKVLGKKTKVLIEEDEQILLEHIE